jgi:hypothetical protein
MYRLSVYALSPKPTILIPEKRGITVDKLTFGLTVLIVGISGTFVTLGILVIFIDLMKRIFPPEGETNAQNS